MERPRGLSDTEWTEMMKALDQVQDVLGELPCQHKLYVVAMAAGVLTHHLNLTHAIEGMTKKEARDATVKAFALDYRGVLERLESALPVAPLSTLAEGQYVLPPAKGIH